MVPANARLTPEAIRAREDEILRPYQEQIKRVLRERDAAGRPTALFSMHSCTDRLYTDPQPRPWQICVIASRDWRIGNALVDVLRSGTELCVGVNEPYTVDMEMDYTIPVHAEAGNVPYVEIEIRQDLIGTEEDQRDWAGLLTRLFPKAVERSGILAG
jgi:predicted N-formylglutamate amidohydrolase